MKPIPATILGAILIAGSLWLGAYGQEQTAAGYYQAPAFGSALLLFLGGFALVITGLGRIIDNYK